MKIRLLIAMALGLALGAACAQDAGAAPSPAQNPGGGYGQRGGRGSGGMGMMGNGRGVTGTVTEVAADHFTVKSYEGQTYTVNFSDNTRILKQAAGAGGGMGMRGGGNPPAQIKATDIKVGDDVAAMGQVDSAAKSVGAMMIMQLDPERAKQMRTMMAEYGKTWLMGKVTAIDGTKVTLTGTVDNAAHTFVADENTTFRERRNPITLADVHVGDMVRVDGAVKDGAFTATSVAVMVMPAGGMPRMPRNAPPQQ